MGLFKKKKNESKLIVSLPCKHKWKDFPWYLIEKYEKQPGAPVGRLTITVMEPYVCIHCKERKDVQLTTRYWSRTPKEDIPKLRDETIIECGNENVLPRAKVEDMINDFQLVDRAYLAAAEVMQEKLRNSMFNIQILKPNTKEEIQ